MQAVSPGCPHGEGKSKSAKARRKLAELLTQTSKIPVHEAHKSVKKQPDDTESQKTSAAGRSDSTPVKHGERLTGDQWLSGTLDIPGGIIGRAIWVTVSFALVLLGARWGSEVGTNRRLKELNAELEHLRAQQEVAHCLGGWQSDASDVETSPAHGEKWQQHPHKPSDASYQMTNQRQTQESEHFEDFVTDEAEEMCSVSQAFAPIRESNKSAHIGLNDAKSMGSTSPVVGWVEEANYPQYHPMDETKSSCGKSPLFGPEHKVNNSQHQTESACSESRFFWAEKVNDSKINGIEEADSTSMESPVSVWTQGANHTENMGTDEAASTSSGSPLLVWAKGTNESEHVGIDEAASRRSGSPLLVWAPVVNSSEHIGIDGADSACSESDLIALAQTLDSSEHIGLDEAETNSQSESDFDVHLNCKDLALQEQPIIVAEEMPANWRLQWANSSVSRKADAGQTQSMWNVRTDIHTLQTNHRNWQLPWASSSGSTNESPFSDQIVQSMLFAVKPPFFSRVYWQLSWANNSALFTLGGGRQAPGTQIANLQHAGWQLSWANNSAVFTLGGQGQANSGHVADLQQTDWQLSWAHNSAVFTLGGQSPANVSHIADVQQTGWQLSWANNSAMIRLGDGAQASGRQFANPQQRDQHWHITPITAENTQQQALDMMNVSVRRSQAVSARDRESFWRLVWTRVS